MGFVFFGSLGVDDFFVGEGKQGPSLAEANHHVSLGHEVIEPFHEVFGDKVSPSDLIVWVLHDWPDDFIANGMHVLEDVLGDLYEDDVVFEVILVELVSSDTKDNVTLALILVDDWGLDAQGDLVGSCAEGVEHFVEVVRPEETIERFSE